MSTNNGNTENKRQLAGALAATLGLVAIACGGDDDAGPGTAGSGNASSGGSGNSGGKNAAAGTMAAAGKNGNDGGSAGRAPTEPDPDITALNALLKAEYSAITAYSAGAGLINGAPNTDPLSDLRGVIVKVAVDIQAQHKLHAAALVEAIEALDGTPVSEQDVAADFKAPKALTDNPTISNVLKYAASAERGAAIAYNQVIAGLEDAKHRFIATSIEGDETQHFIVLAALVLGLASPGMRLSEDTAGDVIPAAFVSKIGDETGLESAPPDYFP